MKKTSISMLAMGLLAGTAHAQSSVTLYGIADAGFTFNSNAKGSHQLALTSGNEGSTRWGLKGSEDLGGGLRAIFTLEAGYSIANGTIGQNGTEFGRQAFVGIDGKLGTVTLGRQYSSASSIVGPIEAGNDWAASGNQYGAHPGDVDDLDNANRINNSIKFQSKDYRGFTFGGLYSIGGVAGDFSRNGIWDLNAAYSNGAGKVAVGYLFIKNPNYSFWGNKANDSTTASNIMSPVFAGYATAGSQQVISAAGNYTFGAATVGLVYSNTQFQRLGSVAVSGLNADEGGYHGTATFNIGEVNFKYRISPALLLGAAYSYTRNSGADGAGNARYQQVDLGAVYSLSARTSLYAVAVRQSARGTDSTGSHAVAAITGVTPSTSGSQTVVTMGLTQRF